MATELRRGHTIEDVALALRVLAYFSGNVSRAARALRQAGHRTSPRTLGRWRDSHYEFYWEIRRQVESNAAENRIVEAVQVLGAWLDVVEPRIKSLESLAGN
jgi:hypothetical protein